MCPPLTLEFKLNQGPKPSCSSNGLSPHLQKRAILSWTDLQHLKTPPQTNPNWGCLCKKAPKPKVELDVPWPHTECFSPQLPEVQAPCTVNTLLHPSIYVLTRNRPRQHSDAELHICWLLLRECLKPSRQCLCKRARLRLIRAAQLRASGSAHLTWQRRVTCFCARIGWPQRTKAWHAGFSQVCRGFAAGRARASCRSSLDLPRQNRAFLQCSVWKARLFCSVSASPAS